MLKQTLSFIEKFLLDEFEKDSPKNLSQIAREIGLSDPSAVLYHVKNLIREGRLIKIKKGVYKTIVDYEKYAQATIPFYGKGRCGPGGYFLEDHPEYQLTVDPRMIRSEFDSVFAVEASGDSMSPVIEDGDLIFAKKSGYHQASSIYVVSMENEIMIKKIMISTDNKKPSILVSINSDFDPIVIDKESFRIIGKVISIVRSVDR
jgi:SOS-response transcriptional repressor LexA